MSKASLFKIGLMCGVMCMGFVEVCFAASNTLICNEAGLSDKQKQQVISFVRDAQDMVQIQGIEAASKAFMSPSFIQSNLYIFVIDDQYHSLANAGRADFVGKDLKSIQDARESAQKIIEKAKQGGGWVSYIWKSPKKHTLQCKTAWVTKLHKDSKSNTIYTLGAGIEH